jgi:hypothetical protein
MGEVHGYMMHTVFLDVSTEASHLNELSSAQVENYIDAGFVGLILGPATMLKRYIYVMRHNFLGMIPRP